MQSQGSQLPEVDAKISNIYHMYDNILNHVVIGGIKPIGTIIKPHDMTEELINPSKNIAIFAIGKNLFDVYGIY